MNDEVAIKIEKVYKDFKLPHEKVNSVKGLFTKGFRNTKSSEKQHALKDINFEVKKGEFFGIVGRNGSGKSTLLKIIAGIYQPTKGSVKVTGKLVPFIELGVGFNPELTGRENVFLNGAILGFTTKQIEANYRAIVDFAELEDFMDQKLKNYSSGMQVRLAFACATKSNAEILLVDEVLAVGDSDFQRKCFDYFKELKNIKKTVVFVTHDMNSVREYCDRALLIDESIIKATGSPSEIANAYSKLFIENSIENTNNENRQGTGKVKINKIETIGPISKKDSIIKIKFHYVVNDDVNSLVAGFKLKDTTGAPILGTNTMIENLKIKNVKRGGSGIIEFNFANMLNSGKYVLEIQLLGDTGEIYDWLIDAKTFSVNTERRTGYIVEPKFSTELTNEK